jgi:hypothetical protein
MEWMDEYLDGTKAEQTALGMIKADIGEYGFEQWLELPAIPIVEWYTQATEEVASQLVDDFKTMISQEHELDELGIEQTMKLDSVESISAFKDGVMDVLKSLLIYLTVQEMASAYYEKRTH